MAVREAAGDTRAAGHRRLALGALAVAAAVLVAATPQRALGVRSPASFPGGAYFVVSCTVTHRSNDDPIVFARQPGKSHSHTFIGNRSADAFSTPDSLRDGRPTCNPATDASAYWVPTLYARGEPVLPLVTILYYVRHTPSVRPFPADLEVIAGNAHARKAQRPSVVSWTCEPPGVATRTFGYPPTCASRRVLHMRVTFPNCWDGRRSDSPDHARHMAYSSGGRCPASHPVGVPKMEMLVVYPPVRAPRLSSGRFSAHGDFMNGWNQDAFATLVRHLND